jgi:hypothetical protein
MVFWGHKAHKRQIKNIADIGHYQIN